MKLFWLNKSILDNKLWMNKKKLNWFEVVKISLEFLVHVVASRFEWIKNNWNKNLYYIVSSGDGGLKINCSLYDAFTCLNVIPSRCNFTLRVIQKSFHHPRLAYTHTFFLMNKFNERFWKVNIGEAVPSSILPYTIAPRTFFLYTRSHFSVRCVWKSRVGATSTHTHQTPPPYMSAASVCVVMLTACASCLYPLIRLHHIFFARARFETFIIFILFYIYVYILFCVALAVKKHF